MKIMWEACEKSVKRRNNVKSMLKIGVLRTRDLHALILKFSCQMTVKLSMVQGSIWFFLAKTARYSILPREELGTSLIPEDVTGAKGSLNNHCSNTPDTSGVKLKIKKIFTCFVIGGNPTKGKTKGILLRKLIFSPSRCVIVILQRLEAFKNCSFQL